MRVTPRSTRPCALASGALAYLTPQLVSTPLSRAATLDCVIPCRAADAATDVDAVTVTDADAVVDASRLRGDSPWTGVLSPRGGGVSSAAEAHCCAGHALVRPGPGGSCGHTTTAEPDADPDRDTDTATDRNRDCDSKSDHRLGWLACAALT